MNEHPRHPAFTAEAKRECFRQMLRIRRFEQTAIKYFSAGKIGGWLVPGIGQEAIAAGFRSVMEPCDHSISGWRGMGHALAAGMEMGPCMAELFGKANGCSKGKGGAFSFFAPAKHHWGCHGLAAAHTPLAAGLAFALKQREERGAAVCFLGEGAVNQGVFHESLNLAGLFNLPVVYVIENNGFAMFTSEDRSSRFRECLARRAEGYDIAWDKTDDQDLYELRARAAIALERARNEHRPTLLEISTYRFFGAAISDANHEKYRSREEIQYRKANRDPLKLWQAQLAREGILDEAEIEEMDRQLRGEALGAVDFAEKGTPPEVEDIRADVYWETDHSTLAASRGRYFFS